MRQARADWQLVKFGGAVHGFSRSDAGRNVKSGYAYDQKADQRSYAMMLSFFDELFN
jgi:dienelactone hydrolase